MLEKVGLTGAGVVDLSVVGTPVQHGFASELLVCCRSAAMVRERDTQGGGLCHPIDPLLKPTERETCHLRS